MKKKSIHEDRAAQLAKARAVRDQNYQNLPHEKFVAERGGPGCLNSFSASMSGASAGVRLPSGEAAG